MILDPAQSGWQRYPLEVYMSSPAVHHTLPLRRIGLPLGIEDLLTGVDSFRVPGVADYTRTPPKSHLSS